MKNESRPDLDKIMQGAYLEAHACAGCNRNYFVYRKPEAAGSGIERCCVCRHGRPVVESYLTKSLFR